MSAVAMSRPDLPKTVWEEKAPTTICMPSASAGKSTASQDADIEIEDVTVELHQDKEDMFVAGTEEEVDNEDSDGDMFLQGSLLFSVVLCLVSCFPQPFNYWREIPGVPDTPNSHVLPSVDTVQKTSDGIHEKTGLQALLPMFGGNKLPTTDVKDILALPKGDLGVQGVIGDKSSLPNVGLPDVPAVSVPSAQLLDLNRRINRLEAVLKLEGRIQEAGEKIMATNGKQVDFETSATTCKAVGGHIATPMNEAENNAIMEFVKKRNSYAYLGIKEGAVPNTFNYLNGIPVVYTHWGKNEPSGKGQESCVEMYTDGTWNDKACNQKRLTICEL
ncbi:pulmonary surfactant-associated protein A-like [Pseudophryne corroboree]|uniref:pulmonary surfactant-associated protein A-like n=1 Tax=Pseudophryne corroboree TaxID=495146 RepID=UPI003081ECF2